MVALKSERRVYLWRMSPHASPKEAPVDVKFEQILQILKTAFDNKEAFAYGNPVASPASRPFILLSGKKALRRRRPCAKRR